VLDVRNINFVEVNLELKGLHTILLVGNQGHDLLCGKIKQIVSEVEVCKRCSFNVLVSDMNFDACVIFNAGLEKGSRFYQVLFENCLNAKVPVIAIVNRMKFQTDIEMYMNVVFPGVRARDIKDSKFRIVTNRDPKCFSLIQNVKKCGPLYNGLNNFVAAKGSSGGVFHVNTVTEMVESISQFCSKGVSQRRRVIVSLDIGSEHQFSIKDHCLDSFVDEYCDANETTSQAVVRAVKINLRRYQGVKLIGRIDCCVFGEETYYYVVKCMERDVIEGKEVASLRNSVCSTSKVHLMVAMLMVLKKISYSDYLYENYMFELKLRVLFQMSNACGKLDYQLFQGVFVSHMLSTRKLSHDRNFQCVMVICYLEKGQKIPIMGRAVQGSYVLLQDSRESVVGVGRMVSSTHCEVLRFEKSDFSNTVNTSSGVIGERFKLIRQPSRDPRTFEGCTSWIPDHWDANTGQPYLRMVELMQRCERGHGMVTAERIDHDSLSDGKLAIGRGGGNHKGDGPKISEVEFKYYFICRVCCWARQTTFSEWSSLLNVLLFVDKACNLISTADQLDWE